MHWTGPALAFTLLATPAAALDCPSILAPFDIEPENVQTTSWGCLYNNLVLDAGDGGLWTIPRAAAQGSGIGEAGAPLRNIEIRIDNARLVLPQPADPNETVPPSMPSTVVGKFARDGSDISIADFAFSMTGVGQIIADGRLLGMPDSFDAAGQGAALVAQAEGFDLVLQVENLARGLALFQSKVEIDEIASTLRTLSESFAALEGQDDNATALAALADAMPNPQGRLRISIGETPVSLALVALSVATGNAQPLAAGNVRLTWTPGS